MRPHVAMVQRSTLKSHLEDGYIPRNISQKHSCKEPHKSHFAKSKFLNVFNLRFETTASPTKIEKGGKRNIMIIYLEPKWPLFWLEKALFWGVDLQK